MNATDDKVAYMRDYRKRYRETPEGRTKLRENNRRWKKSEKGKLSNQRYQKKKYVPSNRVLKTEQEKKERLKKYLFEVARPKRIRKHRENMEHLKRYDLTKEQYLAMLAAQSGGCAICGSSNGSSRNPRVLCVDHCHDTGRIRGLLCDACNKGIGCLKDDSGLVRKALLYLEAYRE